jgi:hypothetical protein
MRGPVPAVQIRADRYDPDLIPGLHDPTPTPKKLPYETLPDNSPSGGSRVRDYRWLLGKLQ